MAHFGYSKNEKIVVQTGPSSFSVTVKTIEEPAPKKAKKSGNKKYSKKKEIYNEKSKNTEKEFSKEEVGAINAIKQISSIVPHYPEQSRVLEEEGTVYLLLVVSPYGQITNANVVKSSGFKRLDHAAVEAVLNKKIDYNGIGFSKKLSFRFLLK